MYGQSRARSVDEECIRTEEVEEVLEEEKEEDLRCHRLQRGERHLVRLHPQALRRRVEQPNLHTLTIHHEINQHFLPFLYFGEKRTHSRQLNRKVREQHLLRARPLLRRRRDLVRLQLPLPEVRDRVDDDPRDAAPEVHNLHRKKTCQLSATAKSVRRRHGQGEEETHLVQQKAHQPRRDDGVTNPHVPRDPALLEPRERGEVGAGVQLGEHICCCAVERHDER